MTDLAMCEQCRSDEGQTCKGAENEQNTSDKKIIMARKKFLVDTSKAKDETKNKGDDVNLKWQT
jgi:hypothetical protein